MNENLSLTYKARSQTFVQHTTKLSSNVCDFVQHTSCSSRQKVLLERKDAPCSHWTHPVTWFNIVLGAFIVCLRKIRLSSKLSGTMVWASFNIEWMPINKEFDQMILNIITSHSLVPFNRYPFITCNNHNLIFTSWKLICYYSMHLVLLKSHISLL